MIRPAETVGVMFRRLVACCPSVANTGRLQTLSDKVLPARRWGATLLGQVRTACRQRLRCWSGERGRGSGSWFFGRKGREYWYNTKYAMDVDFVKYSV